MSILSQITDLTCGICLALYTHPVQLSCCGNTFCLTCLKSSFRTKKACAYCREPIHSAIVRVIEESPEALLNLRAERKVNNVLEAIRMIQHLENARKRLQARLAEVNIKLKKYSKEDITYDWSEYTTYNRKPVKRL